MSLVATKEVLDRLRSAQGHLEGVRRMVERDAPCREVLFQLRAVRGSLMRTEDRLLERHLAHCLLYLDYSDSDAIEELLELLTASPSTAPRSVP